ncbi:MAG: AAA family ATPase [Lachnospiraceae bacterium]|nr:AAA family ATPase [Lachnospiraceae bacterium]
MAYLSQFIYPSAEREEQFLHGIRETCYTSVYPFQILSEHGVRVLNFDEDIVVLYGGNGSGKTTALNVIAEAMHLKRDALYNKSSFFEDYVGMCDQVLMRELPSHSRIITSDDVFDFMLNIRGINAGIDARRDDLFQEYYQNKESGFQLRSIEDYEQLREVNAARRLTKSKYVKGRLNANVREHSNGETAFLYFTENIRENGLYLLDEPENSLSPQRQMELAEHIARYARFFGCQFVIATHSPFLLAMKNAKIYNLDEEKMRVSKWTELGNVRAYYEFFRAHEGEFTI